MLPNSRRQPVGAAPVSDLTYTAYDGKTARLAIAEARE
jgi:hypothetical protein